MSAHWEAFETEIDGTPVWIVFNETAARELPRLDLPNLLRVQAGFETTPEGLPRPECEERLQELESELENWIEAIGGRYVAQVTEPGWRTMFFYVSCGQEEAENLVRRIALRRDMELGFRMQPDAANKVYYQMLLPTADERRRMRDLAAISELAAMGDDLSRPRKLEHLAHFTNRNQAIAFANWARKNGLAVDGILSPGGERPHFTLQFSQIMAPLPENLDSATAAIHHMAGQLGGIYEGWQARPRVRQAV